MAGQRSQGPPRRRRRKRGPPLIHPGRFLRFFGLVLAFIIAVILSLPLLVRADRLRPQLERTLSEMTGRRVELQSLRYSLRHGALLGSEFIIADDPGFGNVPFLEARSVQFDIPFWSTVLGGAPRASRIVLESPTIVLKENAQNRWNYSGLILASSRDRSHFPLPALEIHGGRLGVETDNSQLLEVEDLELDAPNPDLRSALSFTLSGTLMHHGRLKVKGQAGPLDWDQGSPVLPVNALIDLKDFDLSEWNWGAASHLGGLLSIDGSLESNGRTVDIDGQATASKLRFSRTGQGTPDPVETVFTLHHDLDAHSGELRRCDIRVTKGMASLAGAYNTSGSALDLNLSLSMSGASVTQMAQFLPAAGVTLPPGAALEGGAVSSTLKIQGPAEHPTFTGSLDVDDTRLNHFYLSQRLEPVSGLDAQDLDDSAEILSWKCTLQSNGSAIAVQNLVTDIAGLGELSGSGTISPEGSVQFAMSGIRGLTGPKGASIPFTISGDSHDPVFRPAGRAH